MAFMNNPMRAYVINLDRAPERWTHIEESFAKTPFGLRRVPAVDGKAITLPDKDFAGEKFRRCHGRGINLFEIACYWSHIKALRAFLETDEEHALICEDDIVLEPSFSAVVTAALLYARDWNVLRLTGLAEGRPFKVRPLTEGYFLCVHTGRLKGAGAYLVDRKAAKALAAGLMPMWLPYDHAMDREWFFGLHAAAVTPFPVSQVDRKFRSSIQPNSQPRLSSARRWMTTYPYQIGNELTRWASRYLLLARLKRRARAPVAPLAGGAETRG